MTQDEYLHDDKTLSLSQMPVGDLDTVLTMIPRL